MKFGYIMMLISFISLSTSDAFGSTENCCCLKKPASRATASRLTHAQELLGKKDYPQSIVSQSAHLTSVKNFIRKVVRERLANHGRKYADRVSHAIIKESAKEKMDPLFVLAVIETESQFNPRIVGSHGEIGLMQIMPDTGQWISEKSGFPWKGKSTLRDPALNIRIGVNYLAFLREKFEGTAYQYVAAYNMGPGNVRRLASLDIKPKEYSLRVMNNYYGFYQNLVGEP
jgi:soluble lytic murein transglycosylase